MSRARNQRPGAILGVVAAVVVGLFAVTFVTVPKALFRSEHTIEASKSLIAQNQLTTERVVLGRERSSGVLSRRMASPGDLASIVRGESGGESQAGVDSSALFMDGPSPRISVESEAGLLIATTNSSDSKAPLVLVRGDVDVDGGVTAETRLCGGGMCLRTSPSGVAELAVGDGPAVVEMGDEITFNAPLSVPSSLVASGPVRFGGSRCLLSDRVSSADDPSGTMESASVWCVAQAQAIGDEVWNASVSANGGSMAAPLPAFVSDGEVVITGTIHAGDVVTDRGRMSTVLATLDEAKKFASLSEDTYAAARSDLASAVSGMRGEASALRADVEDFAGRALASLAEATREERAAAAGNATAAAAALQSINATREVVEELLNEVRLALSSDNATLEADALRRAKVRQDLDAVRASVSTLSASFNATQRSLSVATVDTQRLVVAGKDVVDLIASSQSSASAVADNVTAIAAEVRSALAATAATTAAANESATACRASLAQASAEQTDLRETLRTVQLQLAAVQNGSQALRHRLAAASAAEVNVTTVEDGLEAQMAEVETRLQGIEEAVRVGDSGDDSLVLSVSRLEADVVHASDVYLSEAALGGLGASSGSLAQALVAGSNAASASTAVASDAAASALGSADRAEKAAAEAGAAALDAVGNATAAQSALAAVMSALRTAGDGTSVVRTDLVNAENALRQAVSSLAELSSLLRVEADGWAVIVAEDARVTAGQLVINGTSLQDHMAAAAGLCGSDRLAVAAQATAAASQLSGVAAQAKSDMRAFSAAVFNRVNVTSARLNDTQAQVAGVMALLDKLEEDVTVTSAATPGTTAEVTSLIERVRARLDTVESDIQAVQKLISVNDQTGEVEIAGDAVRLAAAASFGAVELDGVAGELRAGSLSVGELSVSGSAVVGALEAADHVSVGGATIRAGDRAGEVVIEADSLNGPAARFTGQASFEGAAVSAGHFQIGGTVLSGSEGEKLGALSVQGSVRGVSLSAPSVSLFSDSVSPLFASVSVSRRTEGLGSPVNTVPTALTVNASGHAAGPRRFALVASTRAVAGMPALACSGAGAPSHSGGCVCAAGRFGPTCASEASSTQTVAAAVPGFLPERPARTRPDATWFDCSRAQPRSKLWELSGHTVAQCAAKCLLSDACRALWVTTETPPRDPSQKTGACAGFASDPSAPFPCERATTQPFDTGGGLRYSVVVWRA